MKKKFAAVLLSVCLLVSFCTVTAFAATTTNGLDVTKEITTQNGDTAFVAKVGETQIYIEVKSGGATWPLDTANPFAATVCTVVDAAGNELGTLDSTEGTIDWSVYPDAAQIVCSTDFTGDVYTVVIAELGGGAADSGDAAGVGATMEITTQNSDTAYVTKLGATKVYVEVKSGGATWPLDTANPFAATVCTVVDAAGNELGTLDSTEGTIDWAAFPDAAKIVCSTDFTGDVYDLVVADVAAMGADASAEGPSAPAETPDEAPADDTAPPADVPFAQTPAFGKVMKVVATISYIVMAIWVVIWIVTVRKCYKDGIFGAKRKAKNCPVNGVWDMAVTTPNGISNAVVEFSYDGSVLHGTLNDQFNKDSKAYEGKMADSNSFECLMKIDIGMGSATEFLLKGTVNGGEMKGEMTLTAMSTIKSAFTAVRKG